jgi:hypothetical protein
VPSIGSISTARTPRIYAVDAKGTPCNSSGTTIATILGTVSDPVDAPGTLTVNVSLTVGGTTKSGSVKPSANGSFSILLGPFPDTATQAYNTTADVTATAVDPAKNRSAAASATLTFTNCRFG